MNQGIQLPQGRIQLSRPGGERIVVVAGGRRPDPQWLRKTAAAYPVAVADRGADHCKAAGVVPGFLYGDRDSVAPGVWDGFVRQGARAKTYPVNKDDAVALYRHLWIYSHGIATLCANGMCKFSGEEIANMLTEVFKSLLKEKLGK